MRNNTGEFNYPSVTLPVQVHPTSSAASHIQHHSECFLCLHFLYFHPTHVKNLSSCCSPTSLPGKLPQLPHYKLVPINFRATAAVPENSSISHHSTAFVERVQKRGFLKRTTCQNSFTFKDLYKDLPQICQPDTLQGT